MTEGRQYTLCSASFILWYQLAYNKHKIQQVTQNLALNWTNTRVMNKKPLSLQLSFLKGNFLPALELMDARKTTWLG
jgi:hypothetical protein